MKMDSVPEDEIEKSSSDESIEGDDLLSSIYDEKSFNLCLSANISKYKMVNTNDRIEIHKANLWSGCQKID